MTRMLIVGGTGSAGRAIVTEAVAREHEVTVASRRVPDDDAPGYEADATYLAADLVTTAGLDDALRGQDVVVDAANGLRRSDSHVLGDGSTNLVHAAARWGIHEAVLLSIVGIDSSRFAYYAAKARQERVYLDSLLTARVVRSTQFHPFVADLLLARRFGGAIPAFPGVSLQPIDLADVAAAVVDAAEGRGAPDAVTEIGGPEILTARSIAETVRSARAPKRPVLPIPLPGAIGRTWRSGDILTPDHRAVDGRTFADWLAATAPGGP